MDGAGREPARRPVRREYPERTTALMSTSPRLAACGRRTTPGQRRRRLARELREAGARWGERAYLVERLHGIAPQSQTMSRLGLVVRYMRRSASPGAAAAFIRMEMDGDVRDVLASVRAPTGRAWPEQGRRGWVHRGQHSGRARSSRSTVSVFSWANPSANDIVIEESVAFSRGWGLVESRIACSRRCSSPTSWDHGGRRSSATRRGRGCSNAITHSSAASSRISRRGSGYGRGRLLRTFEARRGPSSVRARSVTTCRRSASSFASGCTRASASSSAARSPGSRSTSARGWRPGGARRSPRLEHREGSRRRFGHRVRGARRARAEGRSGNVEAVCRSLRLRHAMRRAAM